MGVFESLFAMFDTVHESNSPLLTDINHATELSIVNGTCCVDVMGNPYGCDLSEMHRSSSEPFGDSFGMSSCSS